MATASESPTMFGTRPSPASSFATCAAEPSAEDWPGEVPLVQPERAVARSIRTRRRRPILPVSAVVIPSWTGGNRDA